MKCSWTVPTLGMIVSAMLLPSATQARNAFQESLIDHDNFIVAHGWGPERWGCSFTRTQVHKTEAGTKITIGEDSELKPFSCGELIYRKDRLGYGTYSIDMIASDVVGQVTAFFLIANEDTEIDIELTGLNSSVGWMNIWHDKKQNPVSIDLPFDASKDWHNYEFEWQKDFIAWSIDGNLVLNRSDVATSSPSSTNYKLALNSWTQVNPEKNIDWAGIFKKPKDGVIPQAHFRNMRYTPSIHGTGNSKEQEMADEEDLEKKRKAQLKAPATTAPPMRTSAADRKLAMEKLMAIGSSALLGVALTFMILF